MIRSRICRRKSKLHTHTHTYIDYFLLTHVKGRFFLNDLSVARWIQTFFPHKTLEPYRRIQEIFLHARTHYCQRLSHFAIRHLFRLIRGSVTKNLINLLCWKRGSITSKPEWWTLTERIFLRSFCVLFLLQFKTIFFSERSLFIIFKNIFNLIFLKYLHAFLAQLSFFFHVETLSNRLKENVLVRHI